MEPGTVKWFDEAKGYGFVTRENGEDVLVNFSAIQDAGVTNLKAGDAVQFEVVKGPHGWQANKVLPVESPEAVVTGQIMESGRADKVLVFHFKRKKQFKIYGLRQPFSEVRITEIAFDGERFTAHELKTDKLKKAQSEGATEEKLRSAKSVKNKSKSKSGLETKEISNLLQSILEKPWEKEKAVFEPTGIQNPGLAYGGDVILASIMKKLGLRGAVKSETDLVILVEGRLPLTVISSLMRHGILEKEVYSVIVPRRTLQHRRTRKEKLSREESDRAVRLARVTTLMEKVFGDRDAGMRWLRSPKKRFHGRTPMDMITTETGSRLVEEALYQIDEGMAA